MLVLFTQYLHCIYNYLHSIWAFPGGSGVKNPGIEPGSGRSPGEGNVKTQNQGVCRAILSLKHTEGSPACLLLASGSLQQFLALFGLWVCYSCSLSSCGVLTVSPVGSIPSFETQTCRLEDNVVGIGNKNFPSGSLGIIINGATSIFFRRLFMSKSIQYTVLFLLLPVFIGPGIWGTNGNESYCYLIQLFLYSKS